MEKTDWLSCIPYVAYVINWWKSSHGYSPFELTLGFKPQNPLDALCPAPLTANNDSVQSALDAVRATKQLVVAFRSTLEERRTAQNKTGSPKSLSSVQFEQNDLVLVHKDYLPKRKGKGGKLDDPWVCFYLISAY